MPKSVQRWVTSLSSSTKRAGVEQQVDALARGQLAGLVLLLDALLAAAELGAAFEVVDFEADLRVPSRAPWPRGIADNCGAEKGACTARLPPGTCTGRPLYGCVLVPRCA